MSKRQMRMFKLVTGEQVIAMAETDPEHGRWRLLYPFEVVRAGMYPSRGERSELGGPWVVGVSDRARAEVPLEYKHALLVYYEKDIKPGLVDNYAKVYASVSAHGK